MRICAGEDNGEKKRKKERKKIKEKKKDEERTCLVGNSSKKFVDVKTLTSMSHWFE